MKCFVPRHLFLAAALFVVNSAAYAVATQTASDWFVISGAPEINKTDPSAPVVGTGESRSAQNVAVSGTFPGTTLTKAGNFVEISGTLEIIGGFPGSPRQLRFGLFDTNGMPGNTGWLGYYACNASGPEGVQLMKRNPGNNSNPISGTGRELTALGPLVKTDAIFHPGAGNLFDFSMRCTREADNSLTIVWSLNKQGGDYSTTGTCNDTTPQTYTFNRLGFLFGGVLRADKVNLSKVVLTCESESGADVPAGTGAAGAAESGNRGLLFGAGAGALVVVGGIAAFVIRRRPAPVRPAAGSGISPPATAYLPPPPGQD